MEGQRAQSVAGPDTVVRMFGGSGGRAAGRMRQRQAKVCKDAAGVGAATVVALLR